MSADTRTAARAFLRSLNVLLKFARLYEFGHARTSAQFETTWKELQQAIQQGGSGLLLGATGTQILIDGEAIAGAAAERSFAQLLSSAGIASIHFAPTLTQAQFARFVRAFPTGNAKVKNLGEQLKTALAGDPSIKINEIRFVAEDSSVAGVKMATQLTAKVLGAQGEKFKDFLEDPQKMLQLLLSAEGSRGGGPGGGSGGSGWGPGTGGGGDLWSASPGSGGGSSAPGSGAVSSGSGSGGTGTGSGSGWGDSSGAPSGSGTGSGGTGTGGGWGGSSGAPGGGPAGSPAQAPGKWLTAKSVLGIGSASNVPQGASPGYNVAEEDVRQMLSLFSQLGRAQRDPAAKLDVPTFQSRLSTIPANAQFTLQQALAGLAAQAPTDKPDKPMLLQLAEHVAIRFALNSYERGELKVNAVKQMMDRMNQEIEALRKILGHHEEVMAGAGISVESHTDLLDQEFWEQVPDENKTEVLKSEEAWCVPPRNVRIHLDDLLRRGELKTVNEILLRYCSCVALPQPEARSTAAIGISDLAELYSSGDGSALIDAIRRLGEQLAIEPESELQTLVGAAFVRLCQQAASKRGYPAMQQALASLDVVEKQRPGMAQSLRPRIGAEDRIPEFIEEAIRAGEIADGLIDILMLMPKATVRFVTQRFGSCGFRQDCELLAGIVRQLGLESINGLAETLDKASALEAVETVGLLTQLDPEGVEKSLPLRLAQWPRTSHDRVIRQLSAAPPSLRVRQLLALFDSLDPLIKPLAVDEIGMTGAPDGITLLLNLASNEKTDGYLRIKAVEALGRLRAQSANGILQQILETRHMWKFHHPSELRIAAAQALTRIDPQTALQRLDALGIERKDLGFDPVDLDLASPVIRQRRYARWKLSQPVSAVTTNLREDFKIQLLELNLGGGLGSCDRHLAPGTLLNIRIPSGVRPIRAQVLVRGARPQAMAFEFVEMELDDRSRLRKLLLDIGGQTLSASVASRSHRRGRVPVAKS